MKKFFYSVLTLTAAIASAAPASAELAPGDFVIGAYDREDTTAPFGANDEYSYMYDVATKISSEWAGKQIKGVIVPFRSTTGLSQMKAWASTTLDAVDFQPDLASKEFSVTTSGKSFTEVYFDEPITIPENGLYIGYSFYNDKAETEDQRNPVVIGVPLVPGSELLKIHFTGTAWYDFTDSPYDPEADQLTAGILAIIGNYDTADAANIDAIPSLRFSKEDAKIPVTIRNLGWKGVSSIDYTVDIDGKKITGTKTFGEKEGIRAYRQHNVSAQFDVPVTRDFDAGLYPISVSIDNVNGMPNAVEAKSQGMLRLYEYLPKRNPVLEEGTNTACMWCPRGFYGVEVLNRLEPSAIAIVYHSAQMGYNDPMVSVEEVPWANGGLPTMTLDRMMNPENPSDKQSNGFIPAWRERRKEFTIAGIDLSCDWADSEKTQIKVDADVKFIEDINNGNYTIDFALLADDLHDPAGGSNPYWRQANGYTKEDANAYSEDEWRVFVNGNKYVSGLHFNNVFVLGATPRLTGIDGSLPKNITAYEAIPYSYTFDTDKARKLTGSMADVLGEEIIQDKNKLRVVAVLLDSKGEIVNAAAVAVPGYNGPVAIENIDVADTAAEPVAYYDLTGRRVSEPAQGLYIVVLSNGKTIKKIFK